MSDHCCPFMSKITLYNCKNVTVIWQDNKIPNEIPPTALLLRSTSQKFDSLRSLRMTPKIEIRIFCLIRIVLILFMRKFKRRGKL